MILPRFDVLVPQTVEEACIMLAEHGNDGVCLLAGGTDLLVDLRRPIVPFHVPRCDGCHVHPDGNILTTIECGPPESDPLMASAGSIRAARADFEGKPPAYLVSMHKLDELKGVSLKEDGSLRIGALTTITEIGRSADIRKNWTALGEGADSLGSPLVRNRGTLGGNIANARPAADMVIPSVGLGASLTLQGGLLSGACSIFKQCLLQAGQS
jgi:CO/xanthine dehydrogenase FAD-binding subunit